MLNRPKLMNWVSVSGVATAIPQNTVAPVISGTCAEGRTLSCTTGTWTGGAITYTYQWQNGGVDISGETAATYVVAAPATDELGDAITCVVTATNSLGATDQASNALKVVFDLTNLAVPTGASFARSQTGDNTTFFNSSGVMEYASSNEARFDHTFNGTNWSFGGLLLEPERRNLLTQSENFSSDDFSANVTTTTNTTSAPTGEQTADTLTITNTMHEHRKRAVTTSGLAYAYSFYAIRDNVINPYTGAKSDQAGAVVSPVSYLSDTNTSSWNRVIKLFTANYTYEFIQFLVSGGNTLGSVYLFGCQTEQGPSATSYIKTTTAAVTRAQDALTIPIPSGVTSIDIVHADNTTTAGILKSALTDAGGGLYTLTSTNTGITKYNVKIIREAA